MLYDPLTTLLAVVLAIYTSFVALDMGKRVRSADAVMRSAGWRRVRSWSSTTAPEPPPRWRPGRDG